MHILATPTNPGHEDHFTWHFDRRGLFSVKSAYHVLDDGKEMEQVRQEGSVARAALLSSVQPRSGKDYGIYHVPRS